MGEREVVGQLVDENEIPVVHVAPHDRLSFLSLTPGLMPKVRSTIAMGANTVYLLRRPWMSVNVK